MRDARPAGRGAWTAREEDTVANEGGTTSRAARGALLLAWLTGLGAAPGGAAAQGRQVAIMGSVFDTTGTPLADVEVALLGTALVGRTDGRGEFRFPATRAAQYVLRARRLGFTSRVTPVDGTVADTLTLTLNLAPAAPVLPKVLVEERGAPPRTGKLAAFYERMEAGTVPRSSFVTRDEIDRLGPRRTSDIVKTRGPRATGCLNGKVYVDGVLSVSPAQVQSLQGLLPAPTQTQGNRLARARPRTSPRVPTEQAVDVIPPEDVAAIEIYRGAAQAPAQYGGTAEPGMAPGCVILIWTR
jgi:hypothetical protein